MSSDQDFLKHFGTVFLDSYFVVDADRKLQSFNQGFGQMLGLSSGERRRAVGKPCYELLHLEICRERCIALECLERQSAVRMEEIRGRTPDGSRDLVLELSAVPVRSESGAIEGVFVTHRDVTDERRLKERYDEESKDHAEERSSLLKIIEEREAELLELRGGGRPPGKESR